MTSYLVVRNFCHWIGFGRNQPQMAFLLFWYKNAFYYCHDMSRHSLIFGGKMQKNRESNNVWNYFRFFWLRNIMQKTFKNNKSTCKNKLSQPSTSKIYSRIIFSPLNKNIGGANQKKSCKTRKIKRMLQCLSNSTLNDFIVKKLYLVIIDGKWVY